MLRRRCKGEYGTVPRDRLWFAALSSPIPRPPLGRGIPDAAELALGVLYESGIMLPGSRISDYQARPEAQRWMRGLPTVWDGTRYVSGDPAIGAVIARRNGNRRFVGTLKRGAAGTISYPTGFLGSGTWHAEIITDGSNGLVRTSRTVQAGETLTVPSATNGGHVIRLTKVASLLGTASAQVVAVGFDQAGPALGRAAQPVGLGRARLSRRAQSRRPPVRGRATGASGH